MADWKHGLGGYTNHRCRCSDCRAAMATYTRVKRGRQRTVIVTPLVRPIEPHRYYTQDATWDELVAAAIADPSERI